MINLLPWREINYHQKIIRIGYRLLIYILLALLMLFVTKIILQHKTIAIKAETQKVKTQSASIILHNPHHHLLLLQKLKSVDALAKITKQANDTLENYLSMIVTTLPNDITLTSFDFNSKRLKLTGFADQLAAIHQYKTSLENQRNDKPVLFTELHNDLHNQTQLYFTFRIIL